MRVVVAARLLVEIECGNAVRHERQVVGPALVRLAHPSRAKLRDRRQEVLPELVELVPPLQCLPEDHPRPVVEHHDCLDAVGLSGVRRRVRTRAEEPLFLAAEEDEADGALRLEAALRDDPRGFDDGHRRGAVVGDALRMVPAVEVGAENDNLPGELRAPDLADRVPLLGGRGADPVVDRGFDPRRELGVDLAVEHEIVLVRHHDIGERRHAVRRSAHRDERVLLRAVGDGAEGAVLLHEERAVDRELLAALPRRRGRVGVGTRCLATFDLSAARRRICGGHRRAIRVPDERGVVEHDPGAANPVAVRLQFFRARDRDTHHRTGHRPASGPFRPRPAVGKQRPAEGADQVDGDRPALPGHAEGIRFQRRGEAVGAEPLRHPVVCLSHRCRSAEARPDCVAQVLQILHDLGPVHGLGDERAGTRGVHADLGGERCGCRSKQHERDQLLHGNRSSK